MKPLIHAKNSVRKFGGMLEDYLPLHNWMDSTKAHIPDIRHRMVLHNSWGIFLAEQIFGVYFKNADGRNISTRDVLEQHVKDDLGFIPTLERCFAGMPSEPWMGEKQFRGVPMKIDTKTVHVEIVDERAGDD